MRNHCRQLQERISRLELRPKIIQVHTKFDIESVGFLENIPSNLRVFINWQYLIHNNVSSFTRECLLH